MSGSGSLAMLSKYSCSADFRREAKGGSVIVGLSTENRPPLLAVPVTIGRQRKAALLLPKRKEKSSSAPSRSR
jgi:hypothetical protein